jgi:hypothetical protein
MFSVVFCWDKLEEEAAKLKVHLEWNREAQTAFILFSTFLDLTPASNASD